MRYSTLLLPLAFGLAAAFPSPRGGPGGNNGRGPGGPGKGTGPVKSPINPGGPNTPVPSSTAVASVTPVSTVVAPVSSDPPAATNCLAGVSLPAAASALPQPSAGLSLVLVAQGQGTQNYTCASDSADVVPASIGALATLHNISCSDDITQLGNVQEEGNAIGMHFFVNSSTPDFDIEGLGNTELQKTAAVAAPANTDGDVPWLLLTAITDGTTSQVKQIYRVLTQGGTAPTNCSGQPALVTVPYQAEYWFFASS